MLSTEATGGTKGGLCIDGLYLGYCFTGLDGILLYCSFKEVKSLVSAMSIVFLDALLQTNPRGKLGCQQPTVKEQIVSHPAMAMPLISQNSCRDAHAFFWYKTSV